MANAPSTVFLQFLLSSSFFIDFTKLYIFSAPLLSFPSALNYYTGITLPHHPNSKFPPLSFRVALHDAKHRLVIFTSCLSRLKISHCILDVCPHQWPILRMAEQIQTVLDSNMKSTTYWSCNVENYSSRSLGPSLALAKTVPDSFQKPQVLLELIIVTIVSIC